MGTVGLDEEMIRKYVKWQIKKDQDMDQTNYRDENRYVADMIYDELTPPDGAAVMVDPMDITRRKVLTKELAPEELLVPVYRAGRLVYDRPATEAIRTRAQAQLAAFHPGVKRFVNPHEYPVGLEAGYLELKTSLVLKARGQAAAKIGRTGMAI